MQGHTKTYLVLMVQTAGKVRLGINGARIHKDLLDYSFHSKVRPPSGNLAGGYPDWLRTETDANGVKRGEGYV